MTPEVSLVIPAYNHGPHLAEAVKSALAQDYDRLQVIVIDDGSTDGTHEVLASLKGEFTWESQTNVGQARTLSKGWEQASGEILGYLSADDRLAPGAVSAAVSGLLSDPRAAAVYCDFNLIDPESRLIRIVRLPEFDYLRMLTDVDCPIGPGAFFWRSAYLKAGPWNPEYRQMPDFDFWLRLGMYGGFVHIPRPLADYRIHAGSQTYAKVPLERADEPVTIIQGFLTKFDFDEAVVRRSSSSAHLIAAQLHLRAGRLAVATTHVYKAISISPSVVFSRRALRLLTNAVASRIWHRSLWTVRAVLGRERRDS